MHAPIHESRGNLSVTALYTAHTWRWGRFPHAELLASRQTRDVFNATNLAVGVARLFRPRLPSLRHSLVQRHAMFDRICADWIAGTPAPRQVLELAAGLSRRGITFSADVNIDYIELDLPPTFDRKRALLARTAEGRAVLERPNLRFKGGDVTTADLDALLRPVPVLVLAEGLFMYLTPDQQRSAWQRIGTAVSARPGSAFAFDLVPFVEQPRPGFVGRTLERLFKVFTRGRTTTQDARTRVDIAAELRAAGFSGIDVLEPQHVPAWNLPFPAARTQVLLFRCA